jgi:hypothetical protein
MLTTAFSKAKVMEINLPEKIKDPNQKAPVVVASRTMNLILGPNDKIYWYQGNVKPEEYNNLPPLTELDYSAEATGLRMKLLERNRALFKKIDEFKQEVLTGKLEISQDSLTKSIAQLKKDDDTGPIVLIKAYKKSTYGNFVDILDEMNICGIARYTFVPIAWYEEKMVEMATGIAPSTTDSTK